MSATSKKPSCLEDYSSEDLEIYMLLAAFQSGQKILEPNFSEGESDEFHSKAQKYFFGKRYKEAFELFKKISIHNQLDPRGWLGMGMCCQRVGKFKEAISFYECASRVDQNDPVSIWGICNCYLGIKQYLEAIEAANLVVELSKRSSKLEYARLGEQAEHLIECISITRSAASLNFLNQPKDLEQPKNKLKNPLAVEKFWKKEKTEGAQEELSFRQTADTQKKSFYIRRGIIPKKIEELYSLAYDYYVKGIYKEAMSLFVLMSLYDHLDKRAWIGLAATLEQRVMYKKAILAYRAVAHLDSTNPQPYFNISFCYQFLSEKAESIKASEKAFQLMKTKLEMQEE